jgi:hypothetical protein
MAAEITTLVQRMHYIGETAVSQGQGRDKSKYINLPEPAKQKGGQSLTGIQLVADISATSPHHFLVFCHIFASFWRKIKVDIDLESGESCASI